MKKLLFWGDSPTSSSGFARVSNHVLKSLHDTGEYEITVVAINHDRLWYDQKEFPYKIFPAVFGQTGDELGAQLFTTVLLTGNYDVVFMLNDFDVVYYAKEPIAKAREKNPNLKVVAYCPTDSEIPITAQQKTAELVDKLVLYTEFSKKLMDETFPETKDKTTIIPHGTDVELYRPVSPTERKEVRAKAFRITDDNTFLVLNVNRNQWRKDFFKTIHGFLLFWQKHPNSKLYLHCKIDDMGGNLKEQIAGICFWLKLDPLKILDAETGCIILHENFNVLTGVSQEKLNLIYNASDVYVTTTLGEGWGLPVTEAMATETPVIVPNNTSLKEIVGESRGYMVECGKTPNDWLIQYKWSVLPRPTVDVFDFVRQLENVYKNRPEAKLKAHRARKWCKERTWDSVGKMWISLFSELWKQ